MRLVRPYVAHALLKSKTRKGPDVSAGALKRNLVRLFGLAGSLELLDRSRDAFVDRLEAVLDRRGQGLGGLAELGQIGLGGRLGPVGLQFEQFLHRAGLREGLGGG